MLWGPTVPESKGVDDSGNMNSLFTCLTTYSHNIWQPEAFAIILARRYLASFCSEK